MNAYLHSPISQRRWGGQLEDYYLLHEFIDKIDRDRRRKKWIDRDRQDRQEDRQGGSTGRIDRDRRRKKRRYLQLK